MALVQLTLKRDVSDLIGSYQSSSKNDCMILNELSNISGQAATYRELQTADGAEHSSRFGYAVDFNAVEYRGFGYTKKDAKTKAASVCLTAVFGVEKHSNTSVTTPDNELKSNLQKEKINKNSLFVRNPLSFLQELCQREFIPLEITCKQDETHSYLFSVEIFLNGQVVSAHKARDKKSAKKCAAIKALQKHFGNQKPAANEGCGGQLEGGSSTLAKDGGPGSQLNLNMNLDNNDNLYGRIADAVQTQFCALVTQLPECMTGKKVLSGIVLENHLTSCLHVVALATGNRCLSGDNISTDGDVIFDSHAEILAMRAFKRFLFLQIKRLKNESCGSASFSPCPPAQVIFPPPLFVDSPNSYRFDTATYRIHMFSSSAPCGDASVFVRNEKRNIAEIGAGAGDASTDSHPTVVTDHRAFVGEGVNTTGNASVIKYGLLRAKLELGQGCIPVKEDDDDLKSLGVVRRERVEQAYGGIIQGERFRTMSCSDKILKWNKIGFQGALLGQLLAEPLLLSSITIGNLYQPHHQVRAYCCRLGDDGDIHHPVIAASHLTKITRDTEKLTTNCANWCAYDDRLEMTDGRTGKMSYSMFVKNKQPKVLPPSRLCKRKMCQLFQEITDEHPLPYYSLKQKNIAYQRRKTAFYRLLREHRLGIWIGKACEVDSFVVETPAT